MRGHVISASESAKILVVIFLLVCAAVQQISPFQIRKQSFEQNRHSNSFKHIEATQRAPSSHTHQTTPTYAKNNWAVIVSTSNYWYNYRHEINALSMYQAVKQLGIDDSHIILMLAEDSTSDLKGSVSASIFRDSEHLDKLFDDVVVEADFRGIATTSKNFLNLLTSRHRVAPSKRLATDDRSNILIYLTGRSDNGSIKFQDDSELTATELAQAIDQLHRKRRYNEILLIVDMSQAESLLAEIHTPNIIGVGSSKIGQASVPYFGDFGSGVYVIDRYTKCVVEFLSKLNQTTVHATYLSDIFKVCSKEQCLSDVVIRMDSNQRRPPDQVALIEFFGAETGFNFIGVDKLNFTWMEANARKIR